MSTYTEGRYLMRAGEELVGMTPDQLKSIFSEGQPEFIDLAARGNCSEEEVVTLLDIQSYFDLKDRPFPSTRKEALQTFVQKGFLIGSEGSGSGRAGACGVSALLFAVRKQRDHEQRIDPEPFRH